MTENHPLIGKYFPVLDHGFVALVDYMGDDDAIVQAARTSYGFGTKSRSEDRGLIRYLKRHRHTGPFEQAELKFHVRLPIFVARQLVRHRTAMLNEVSLRYSLAPLQYYTPSEEQLRKQSLVNRQGRGDEVMAGVYEKLNRLWRAAREAAAEAYVFALENEVARELARIDLPLSLYTEWYWKVNLHNFFHFTGLRADTHAQWEIQEYARVKGGIVKQLFPLAWEAFIDYQLGAVTLSRMEVKVVRSLIGSLETTAGLLSRDSMAEKLVLNGGLSEREAKEFVARFTGPEQEMPSFELDVASARTAEEFYEDAKSAVPVVSQPLLIDGSTQIPLTVSDRRVLPQFSWAHARGGDVISLAPDGRFLLNGSPLIPTPKAEP